MRYHLAWYLTHDRMTEYPIGENRDHLSVQLAIERSKALVIHNQDIDTLWVYDDNDTTHYTWHRPERRLFT